MENLSEEGVTKKQIIFYEGCIGPKKNPYLALENKLKELVDLKELGFVFDSFSNEKGYIKSVFRHSETELDLVYESSPSPWGRDENLFILIPNSGKNYSGKLKKCELWWKKELRDFLD